MSCADNRLLHSALLDGELEPAERAQVEAHLATCADCTAELAALARTLGMLHALPAARAPLGFVDRVLEAARPMPWHRRLGRRLFQPLRVKLPLEAAAVVLVALGAVYVFQNTPELQQAARQEQPASAPVPVAPPATPAPGDGTGGIRDTRAAGQRPRGAFPAGHENGPGRAGREEGARERLVRGGPEEAGGERWNGARILPMPPPAPPIS